MEHVHPQEVFMPDSAAIPAQAHDRGRQEYGGAIGQHRDELITPALMLDIDAAQRTSTAWRVS